MDPDEGLHAAIAQEMARSGDWVVPSFLGKPFLDKPILYFWAEAGSLRLFGKAEWAVRLPGLLLGLLGMIATGIAGGRMFGLAAGVLAAMFYATMILPTALVQSPSHDVALVPCVTLAILLFWEAEQAQSRRATAACTLAIGLLLGLSILTKGLAGVALVGIAYGGYLLFTRRLTTAICAAERRHCCWPGSSARHGTSPWNCGVRASSATISLIATCWASPPARRFTAASRGGTICQSCCWVGCLGSLICLWSSRTSGKSEGETG